MSKTEFEITNGPNQEWVGNWLVFGGGNDVYPPVFDLKDIQTKMKGKAALDVWGCWRRRCDEYGIYDIDGRLWWDPNSKSIFRIREAQPFRALYDFSARKGHLTLGEETNTEWTENIVEPLAQRDESITGCPDRHELVSSLFGTSRINADGKSERGICKLEFVLPFPNGRGGFSGTYPLYGTIIELRRLLKEGGGSAKQALAFKCLETHNDEPQGIFKGVIRPREKHLMLIVK